jgi:exonuclease III
MVPPPNRKGKNNTQKKKNKTQQLTTKGRILKTYATHPSSTHQKPSQPQPRRPPTNYYSPMQECCTPALPDQTNSQQLHQRQTSSHSLVTINFQNIRTNFQDLQPIIDRFSPRILFGQETHLTHDTSRPKELDSILVDYQTFYSCSPIKKRKLSAHRPNKAAPGGVSLSIHKEWMQHPLAKRLDKIPHSLQGYCIHVTLPLPNSHTLHTLNVYIPPASSDSRNAITQALKKYIANILDQNRELPTPSHHILLAGDLNRHTIPDFDLHQVDDGKTLTHYPNASSHQPSALDQFLISGSLFHLTNTNTRDLVLDAPSDTPFPSDHLPLHLTYPPRLLPILHGRPPPYHPPPSTFTKKQKQKQKQKTKQTPCPSPLAYACLSLKPPSPPARRLSSYTTRHQAKRF